MSRIALLIVSSLLTALTFCGPAAARDTSVKVLINGEYWFCQSDPTGWTLSDFKAVCSLIGPGGKGEFVEFIVDGKGKVRRKPVSQRRSEMRAAMRGTLS